MRIHAWKAAIWGPAIFLMFCPIHGYNQVVKPRPTKPAAEWRFEDAPLRVLTDPVTGIRDTIAGNFRIVRGVNGNALKLDGFTTVATRAAGNLPRLDESVTLSVWVALATYPWNWCPIAAQDRKPAEGFYFGIGPQGQAGIFASVNGSWSGCETKTKLPLRKWVHVIATIDADQGFRIYIDGQLSAEQKINGQIAYSPGSDLLIGQNRITIAPSNPVREYATLPGWFSLDGILDELAIYSGVVSPGQITVNGPLPAATVSPDLPARVMPSGPAGPGRFGAYYTKLSYYDEWDALFRVGDYTDVVVQFDNSPIRVVFWRGTRYSPAWVMEDGRWMADQSAEYFDTINGCFEHMIDPHCLYSHVRIIENTPARVVVHWRYVPVSVRKQLSQVDERSGWSDCIDEYYTFYPDGIGVRKVVQYTSGEPLGPSEAIALCQPGTTPEDNVNLDAMTLVNLMGESHVYSWANGAPQFTKGKNPENPVIQIVNLKSQYKPFMIFEPENAMAVYGIEQRPDASHFPWWNHWPVAQLPSDGRFSQSSDRASHFSLAWGGPPFHDEKGRVIRARDTGSEGDLQPLEPNYPYATYWSAWIYGASLKNAQELSMLARSWIQPPEIQMVGKDYHYLGYDRTQRTYKIKRTGNLATAEMILAASENYPLSNLCIQIEGWDAEDLSVRMNGLDLLEHKDYRLGFIRKLEGNLMIIWIKVESQKPVQIALKPVKG